MYLKLQVREPGAIGEVVHRLLACSHRLVEWDLEALIRETIPPSAIRRVVPYSRPGRKGPLREKASLAGGPEYEL
jgi:hypothetical protein